MPELVEIVVWYTGIDKLGTYQDEACFTVSFEDWLQLDPDAEFVYGDAWDRLEKRVKQYVEKRGDEFGMICAVDRK